MPTAENDPSPKGLPYGAEKAAAEFVAANKPIQAPVTFGVDQKAPPSVPYEPDYDPAELVPPEFDIPGIGNLGSYLFSPTDRPEEPLDTNPMETTSYLDTPAGPPRLYQEILHDPNVSSTTKSLIEFVTRVRMLMPSGNQMPKAPPTEYSRPEPRF